MEQFNFDEMKEIIKSHSLEEIDQEYDIRHSISEKENTSIINGIVDLIDPNKEIFTNNNLSSDEKLQILLMILKYQTHNIDYQKLQNMLEINHYNWQAELLKALSYIDSINLKEITFDKAQLFMKAYFSIKDLEIIDNNIYLLDTIYGKTKVFNAESVLQMESINPEERHQNCHLLTASSLHYTSGLFGAYYHIPRSFKGYYEHSIILNPEKKLAIDFANNFIISYPFFQKYYGIPSYIISSKEYNDLDQKFMNEYNVHMSLTGLETIRLLKKKQR